MTALTEPAAVPERPGLLARIDEDVWAVLARDPAARTRWEVLTTYPGIHALIWHRLANVLWRRGLRYPARLLGFTARFLTNIDIHPGATIGRRFFIDHGAGVVIGETAEIGDDVTLYHGVTLGGTSSSRGKRHPTLEDGVLVGAGAKILGPVTLGRGARVGANSVVIADVPAGMTVVGIPGRVVRAAHEQIGALDHHRLPDPVGRALHCMQERITQLEAELARLRQTSPQAPCPTCADPCREETRP